MRTVLVIGLALISSQTWAQTAPTRPVQPVVIPTLPTQAAQPNAPCRSLRFEPCSSANLPPGTSVATPRPLVERRGFTADQAKNAIEAIGYDGVTDLYRDPQGKWHGRAFKEGQAVSLTLDLNGKVVVSSVAAIPQ